jgi:hypothetical protein
VLPISDAVEFGVVKGAKGMPQPVARPWNDLRRNRQLMELFPKPIRARFDRQVLGVWKASESKPF